MRNKLIFLLILTIHLLSCNTKSLSKKKFDNESDSLIYTLINVFVKDNHIKKIPELPSRSYYINTDCGNCDSTMDEIDKFFNRIKDNLSNPVFNKADWKAFRNQILEPAIKQWEKDCIDIRVTKESTFWNSSYPISVPLFSQDKKKAVIFANYFGMSRVYLYKYNTKTKTWKYDTQIWQDGS